MSSDMERPSLDQDVEHSAAATGRLMSDTDTIEQHDVTERTKIQRLLYTSHFLSAWNSRAFEFGAFLFLAAMYPGTLLPASVYALSRNASAAILSPSVGKYIDNVDRMTVVRTSIVGQRASVALSCILLLVMITLELPFSYRTISALSLTLLSLLACVEKLCSVMNTISVERDWVIIVAGGDETFLRALNSQMRRIDLFCKLVGPLVIALLDGISTKVAILFTFAMTSISITIEYFAIARVYKAVPALRKQKTTGETTNTARYATRSFGQKVSSRLKSMRSDMSLYLAHPALLPSFTLALLYLTVLSFSGSMVTYLIATGLTSTVIGAFRGLSAIFELSATWLAPKAMSRIGAVRSGIWFINIQIFFVGVACAALWFYPTDPLGYYGLIGAVIASRVGLWGFELSAQLIVQDEVEPQHRGMFSSQEFSLQNGFEMLSFASTTIWSKPEQFRYPATISAGAVGLAGVLYAVFVRHRRGHLLHLSRCLGGDKVQHPGANHGNRGDWVELA